MSTKKSNESFKPSFRAETNVFEVAENEPHKAVNLATGEVRNASDFKTNHTWQKVTLKRGN
jgi:hypothetical protein